MLEAPIHSSHATGSGTATSTETWIGSRLLRALSTAARPVTAVRSAAERNACAPDLAARRTTALTALRAARAASPDRGFFELLAGGSACAACLTAPFFGAAPVRLRAAGLARLAAAGFLAAERRFAVAVAMGSADGPAYLLGLLAHRAHFAGQLAKLPSGGSNLLGHVGEVDLHR